MRPSVSYRHFNDFLQHPSHTSVLLPVKAPCIPHHKPRPQRHVASLRLSLDWPLIDPLLSSSNENGSVFPRGLRRITQLTWKHFLISQQFETSKLFPSPSSLQSLKKDKEKTYRLTLKTTYSFVKYKNETRY